MNFKKDLNSLANDIFSKDYVVPVRKVDRKIKSSDLQESKKVENDFDLNLDLDEDFDLDIEDEPEEKVEQLFDGYLGEKNFAPNPLEYGPNAMYRQNGTVYRKSVDNLWEEYLKDGSPGARGAAGGSGTGVQEVQKIIENAPTSLSFNGYNLSPKYPIADGSDGYIKLNSYKGYYDDGITPSDEAWLSACNDSIITGKCLLLPPGDVVVTKNVLLNKLHGIPGKSRLIVQTDIGLSALWPRPFLIKNKNFNLIYSNPDYIEYKDFEIICPASGVGFTSLCLANVSGGYIENIIICATAPGGKYDPIIDLMACCKNIIMSRLHIENLTDHIQGACMAIRNICNSSANPLPITENNVLQFSYMKTTCKDEAISVYPADVRPTNYNTLYKNIFIGSIGNKRQERTALVALLGIGNRLIENNLTDSSSKNYIVRLGHDGSDSNVINRDLVSYGNFINVDRDFWAHDTWVSAGSSGTDPDSFVYGIRTINQTLGEIPSTYFNCYSINDVIKSIGINPAYCGMYNTNAKNCTVIGFKKGSYISRIYGGEYTTSSVCHLDPKYVKGGMHQCTNGPIIQYNSVPVSGAIVEDVEDFISPNNLISINANTSAAIVRIQRNRGTVSASTYPPISINNKTSATRILIRDNDIYGGYPTLSNGFGDTIHYGNWYNTSAID